MGREADLGRLDSLFAGGSRLVTVVGSPGVGKTRLGIRFLARRDPSTAVAFCDVRDATSPEDLCVELSRSLRIQLADGQGQADLVSAVGNALAARGRCLVVLDNFEQLVALAATCVSTWLRTAPELCLLITSRRVLRLEAEHVYELPPLALPQGDADWSNASMQLFYDRAVCVDPTLQRDAATAAYAGRLVRCLEGIPLAIELASSRLRRLAPRELLQRIELHVIELASDSRDVCQRHATLRHALAGSWQLLTPLERLTLAQLTVFTGGFTSGAAEAVVDYDGERNAPAVLEVLGSLREMSLLRVETGQDAVGTRRWDLYASIAEYASENADESTVRAARSRHAMYYASEGERLTARLRGAQGPHARQALRADVGNLRAAMTFAAADGYVCLASRLGLALHAAIGQTMN